MPISRIQFQGLDNAPSIIEKISIVLKENIDKAYSLEEIHHSIFGENPRLVDMIFSQVALMILNERRDIEVKLMHEIAEDRKLYFAWKKASVD